MRPVTTFLMALAVTAGLGGAANARPAAGLQGEPRSSTPTLAVASVAAVTRGDPPDGVEQALDPRPGDPLRGRAIVASRQKGLCLLCHSAPVPEERFQGNLAPDLAGVGSRWSAAQLRARLIDPQRIHPASQMPAYFRTDHLHQVGTAWRGRTILEAAEIEDVIAYLLTLREPAPAAPAR